MKRILIVDDQAIVAEPLAIVLRQAGYAGEVVTSAASALAACRKQAPDLVVCDIDMPGASGLDFLRDLRADPGTAPIPVMMLTGFQDAETVHAALLAGACDYLLKGDFSLSRFLQRVARHFAAVQSGGLDQLRPAVREAGPSPAQAQPGRRNGTHSAATDVARPRPQTAQMAQTPTPPTAPPPPDYGRAMEAISTKAGKHAFGGVVRDILRLSSSQSAGFDEMAVVLRRDPLLSAQILGASNAAAARSGRGSVNTLIDAARLLGFGRVRNLAITLGIFATLPPDSATFSGQRCWQHCIATALILERVAGSDNYLIGLCHDLGEVLVREALTGTPEAAWIDLDKGQLRRVALERVGLPMAMVVPMVDLIGHDLAKGAAGLSGISRQLAIAHCYAHALGFSWSDAAELPELADLAAADVTPFHKLPWDDLIEETIMTAMQVLGVPPPGVRAPPKGRSLLYVHGITPQPSPLGLALSRWTACTTAISLPRSPSDYAGMDGVILGGGPQQLARMLAAAPRELREKRVLVAGRAPEAAGWKDLRAEEQLTVGGLAAFLAQG